MAQSIRVLIVEDEIFIAMSLEMELKQERYGVCRRVATGEEAVAIAQEESPDVILMDIRLAGAIDGIEAAKRIRAFSDIPIIFMTGYQSKAIEERAKALHPLGFFVKPVQVNKLKPLIDSTA
ncbi:MAG: response regulator [Spirochaetes bacterium]|nr:response regulator [Spirochaetota bacterium]